jgi:hypothetical protein
VPRCKAAITMPQLEMRPVQKTAFEGGGTSSV